MERRTVVWRGLDAPRMEIAHVDLTENGLRARGTQIGAGYELRYEVDEPSLRVEVVGVSPVEFTLGDTDHFDLEFSPLFNSLPVRGHWLQEGDARDFVMTLIEVPDLTARRSEQRYERLAAAVRFRSGDFAATLDLDDDGIVTRYPDLAEIVL